MEFVAEAELLMVLAIVMETLRMSVEFVAAAESLMVRVTVMETF